MVIDQTGSLSGVRRHDYLPFGEEIQAGVGGRTTSQGYVDDNLRQKWAKLERDGETGLDYAQARYYSSTMGRFTSPDPLLSSGMASAPQTWNRYSYALNNPLKYIDPTGLVANDPKFWVTDGNNNYNSVTQEEWDDYLNENPDTPWTRAATGTNIGVLWDVTGPTDFYLQNNQLIGKEVVLGADGNFQLANPENPYLNCEGLVSELGGKWGPPLKQSMEYMFQADMALIGGFTTLGSVGTTTLGLEGAGATTAAEGTGLFAIHPRVAGQLQDVRLGNLAGKMTSTDLQAFVNNPAARRLFDANTGHINVIQQVDSTLLRITVPRDAMKIISVGPIRANGVANGIANGRFIPLP
jgi:RHS repeat-associated protein